MKYYFIYLVLFLCTTMEMEAQNVTISEDLTVRNDVGYELLGRYKGNILLFRDKNDNFEVNAFDEQMRTAWTHKLEFPEKKIQILDAVQGKDYFAVIYKCKDKGNTLVKVHRFDANAKFIDSTTIKNYGQHFMPIVPTSIFSENKKMTMIYSYSQDESLEASAFDLENMKILWQKNITLAPEVNFRENFSQVLLSDKGQCLFVFKKENNSLFGASEESFMISETSIGENRFYRVPFKNYTVFEVQFGIDNLNQQLCAAGLIAESSKNRPTGCFFLRITNEAQKLSIEDFDDELVSIMAGKKVTNNKGLPDLKPKTILMRKDGGAVVLLEDQKEYSRAGSTVHNTNFATSDASGRFVVDYYADNIVAISFNPDGTVHWKKVLPKKQFSQDDDGIFSSYAVMKTPNSVRLLFNDDIRAETTTSEYIMHGDGLVDRHSMFNTTNQDILLRFQDALQISSDETVIPSEYRGKLKLVRIRY
jgi:hypothetical protein